MAPRSAENPNRINVFFSDDALAALKQDASERGMTVSGLVRFIVMEWIRKEKK